MSDEGYPPDVENEPSSYDYTVEQHGRADILYTQHGAVAHVWFKYKNEVECGLDTWVGWLGTGTMQEREKAHILPVCKRCLKTMGETHLTREQNPR